MIRILRAFVKWAELITGHVIRLIEPAPHDKQRLQLALRDIKAELHDYETGASFSRLLIDEPDDIERLHQALDRLQAELHKHEKPAGAATVSGDPNHGTDT